MLFLADFALTIITWNTYVVNLGKKPLSLGGKNPFIFHFSVLLCKVILGETLHRQKPIKKVLFISQKLLFQFLFYRKIPIKNISTTTGFESGKCQIAACPDTVWNFPHSNFLTFCRRSIFHEQGKKVPRRRSYSALLSTAADRSKKPERALKGPVGTKLRA